MNKIYAYEILTRLGEKGILERSTSKEITKDIKIFLKKSDEEESKS